MADLIKKFFQSELTETEDRTLAEELASSEKAAERFAESAEKAYYALGLPEPRMTGKWAKFFHSIWGKLFWVLLVGGGIAVFYWLLRPENRPVPAAVPGPEPRQEVVPLAYPTAAQIYRSPRPIGTPPTPAGFGEAPPEQSFVTDYRNLKLVVTQESDGLVVVKVLGPAGDEVRRLYDGPLDKGKWIFNWDGLLDNGQPAVPGTYRIEVEGGTGNKSQEVLIREKKSK